MVKPVGCAVGVAQGNKVLVVCAAVKMLVVKYFGPPVQERLFNGTIK